jgi:nickel superoxide dismutase
MKTYRLALLVGLVFSALSFNQKAYGHCQVPCGIYEDSTRVKLIQEHITTIEKSMNMINKLSAEGEKNYNQIVRWVNNKEEHANKIQEIVSKYFLHQRIKPVEDSDDHHGMYMTNLKLLHHLSVYAMKCKQTTDLAHVAKLRELTHEFSDSYFHKVAHDHGHDHKH